jgi:dihydroorotase
LTDLLLRGGRVYDPAQSISNQALDVAVSDGRITQVAASIDPTGFASVIDVTGKIVAPGLIDLHTHVYHGFNPTGVHPDVAGVGSGVTTVVDGGSGGHANFGGFPSYVVPSSKTRVLCMVHVGPNGLSTMPEITSAADIDVEATAATVRDNRPLTQGVKIRAIGPAVLSDGIEIVKLARRAAAESDSRLMVHIGELFHDGRTLTRELLPLLQPGDIVTHTFTPNPGRILDDAGKVIPEILDAQERGVTLDTAFGRFNFGFDVARRAIDQGVRPDTIATDITVPGRANSVFSMTEMMTRFLALGFALDDVIAMTTANSARALDMADTLGSLEPGREADISVLEAVSGDWTVADVRGETLPTGVALRPALTVRAGEVITPDWGPHPWGFLPQASQ